MVADDETFYIDSIGPEVVDIDLEPGSDTGALNDDGLTNADTLHFRVEFSEPLAGLGVEDFWAGGGDWSPRSRSSPASRARCTVSRSTPRTARAP